MTYFIYELLFIFVIFVNSVQSMPNPPGGYDQDPWLAPNNNPGTVYVNGESHSGRFVGGIFHPSRPTTLEGLSQQQLKLHRIPPVPVRFINDGDLLYRGKNIVGQFSGNVPYHTDFYTGQRTRTKIEDGDLVKRGDLKVAVVEDKGIKPYYHQVKIHEPAHP